MENNPSKSNTVNVPNKSSSDFPNRTSTEEINENHHHYQKGTGSKLPVLMKKGPKNFMAPTISAASKVSLPKKKILAERNEVLESFLETQIEKTDQMNLEPCSESLSSDSKQRKGCNSSALSPCSSWISDFGERFCISPDASALPYDPLTNYLSPRPQFLRYKPNRRLEMVLQRETQLEKREKGGEGFDLDGSFSLESESGLIGNQEKLVKNETLPNASFWNKESEIQEAGLNSFMGKSEPSIEINEEDDEEDEEEEEDRPRCSDLVFRSMFVLMALIIGLLSFSARYRYDLEPSPNQNAQIAENHRVSQHRFPEMYWGLFNTSQTFFPYPAQDPHAQIAENHPVSPDRFPEMYWELFNTSQTFFPYPAQDQDDFGEELSPVPRLTEIDGENNGDQSVFYPTQDLISDEKQLENSSIEGETGEQAFNSNFSDQEQDQNGDLITMATTQEVPVETGKEKEDFKDWMGGFLEQIEIELHERENSGTFELPLISTESNKIDYHYTAPDHQGDFATRETSWTRSLIPSILSVHNTAIHLTILAVVAASLITGSLIMVYLYLKNKKTSLRDSALSDGPTSDSKISLKSNSAANSDDGILQKSESHFDEHSSLLEYEYSNLYRTCPPEAQLLGEYAPGEIRSSDKKSGLRSESEGRESVNFSQQTSSRSISLSSATINYEKQTFPEISSAETPSYGSFTTQEKLARKKEVKKQESGDEQDGKKKDILITPVRRSSRIRNRVMSP